VAIGFSIAALAGRELNELRAVTLALAPVNTPVPARLTITSVPPSDVASSFDVAVIAAGHRCAGREFGGPRPVLPRAPQR
jgi:hypothetical protein